MKPTQSAIRAMIAAQAPDHTPEGKEVLASKLSFMSARPEPQYRKEKKAAKPKQKNAEEALQIQIVQFLLTRPRIQFWANNPQVFIGKMNYAKMNYLNKLKRMGHKKGVPDICLLFRAKSGQSRFCFIELKSEDGKPSQEQIDFMFDCDQRGGYSAVVRSVEDLLAVLERAGY